MPGVATPSSTWSYFLGYGVSLTATTLGIAEGSVKNALFKARASPAKALGVAEEVDG